jgi:hypothetical protein
MVGSFKISLQVGVCSGTHSGSDNHGGTADPKPKTKHNEEGSKFSGHFLPF